VSAVPSDDEKTAAGVGGADVPAGRAQESGATEDQMLAEVQRGDVTAQTLGALARNPEALKSRKVALALVTHPRTPRHVAVPLLRRMFTFDLMQVTLTPVVAADIKRAGEEQLLLRLESVSTGAKTSLARRASGRVAAALLQEPDTRVITPALDNAQLTEAMVVQALMRAHAPEDLFVLVSDHQKWAQRREVQIALLRNEKTPVQRARGFTKNFSSEFLREILPELRWKTLMQTVDSSTKCNSATEGTKTEESQTGDSE
jgi:hypothetical protein